MNARVARIQGPLAVAALAVAAIGIVRVITYRPDPGEPGPNWVVIAGATGSCRPDSPCGSVAEALALALPGDVVEVGDGAYEALSATTATAAKPSNEPVTVRAKRGTTPHLAALVVGRDDIAFDGISVDGPTDVEADHVRLERGWFAGVTIHEDVEDVVVSASSVEIRHHSTSAISIAGRTRAVTIDGTRIVGGQRGVHVYSGFVDPSGWAQDITISNSDISGASGDTIQIAGARNIELRGNVIHDPQENDDHNDGIQSVGSDGLRITGNVFSAPGAIDADQAIILSHAVPRSDVMRVTNSTVANNLIHNWRGSGITVAGADDTTIVNNTSYDNGDPRTGEVSAALFIGTNRRQFANHNLRVFNNVFENIRFEADTPPPTYEDFNCVRQGGGGPHDVARDPRFADRDRYRLSSDSPCRAVGTSDDAPTVDIDNRPRQRPPDMGATQSE